MDHNDLMLEKMKIDDRLRSVEAQVIKMTEIITAHYNVSSALLEKLTRQLDAQDLIIRGDGKKELGLSTRVDRLEQSEETRKWAFRTMIGATIAMIIKIFHDLIRKT